MTATTERLTGLEKEVDLLSAEAVALRKRVATTWGRTADRLPSGKMLFTEDDGLLLLGPDSDIWKVGSAYYWMSSRKQIATVTGAIHWGPGRWPDSRALAVEEAITQPIYNPLINGTYVAGLAPSCAKGGDWTGCSVSENTNSNYTQYGGKSQKVVLVNTPVIPYWYQSCKFAVSTEYTVRIRLYIASLTTSVRVRLNGDAGGVIDNTFTALGWHEIIETITTDDPVGSDTALFFAPNNDAATFYIDVMTVEPNDYTTIPFDGDSGPGYTWAGAAQGSAPTRAATLVRLNEHTHLVNNNNTLSFRTVIQMPYDYDGNWPEAVYNVIWDVNDGTNNNRWYFFYYPLTNIVYLTYGIVDQVHGSPGPFSAGDWLDIVVTIDCAADTYYLYVNGALVGSSTIARTAPTGMDRWALGNDPSGSGYHGNFTFAEYAVFDRVLTASEISVLYHNQRPLIDEVASHQPLARGRYYYDVDNSRVYVLTPSGLKHIALA